MISESISEAEQTWCRTSLRSNEASGGDKET